MPRFYFHIYNDDITTDEEGLDLADVDVARERAVEFARDLLCQDARQGSITLSDRIVVEDEQHRPALTLRFGDAVKVNA
jgi:hypothetical protein